MLTDTRIRNAKPKAAAYKLADAKGLYVEVRPTGSKLFRYRYRLPGLGLWKKADNKNKIVEHVFTIGEYFDKPQPGHVSLDEARTRRMAARALVKQGACTPRPSATPSTL